MLKRTGMLMAAVVSGAAHAHELPDGTPPVDYAPVNNALLLDTSRISDFYTLLGNEAVSLHHLPALVLLVIALLLLYRASRKEAE